MFLRDVIEEEGGPLYEIVGGMDLLPKALATRLAGLIELKTEVTGIYQKTPGKIKVGVSGSHRTSGGEPLKIVLCTLPFSVLRTLEIYPPFSPVRRNRAKKT